MAKVAQGTNQTSSQRGSLDLALPVSLVLVTLVAAAAGMAIAWLAKPTGASGDSGPAAVVSKQTKQVLELPSIIGQLGVDRKVWFRIDLSVLVQSEAAMTSVDTALLADDYLGYIQTLSVDDLSAKANLRLLKEDLEERARIRLRAQSAQVVFRSMVIE